MSLYFDIETEPQPEPLLRELCPPFDPEAVKVGNLGPAKAAEKIAEAAANHFTDFCADAALTPFKGRVCVIGLRDSGKMPNGTVRLIDCTVSEEAGLRDFWRVLEETPHGNLVGFNTHGFDLPFLIKRSWVMGVPVPQCLRLERDRFWPEWNIDLRKIWQCGDFQAHGKLDDIARALGLQGKTGDHGAHFGQLWRDPETRSVAEDYLRQDVLLCERLHARLVFGGNDGQSMFNDRRAEIDAADLVPV
jgi:Zn ribbon nucleic-acid-binding protein